MADNNYIVIDHDNDHNLGEIKITQNVIEILLGIAASQVEGVYAMQGNLSSNLHSLIGRSSRSKGVNVSYDPQTNELAADLYVYLKYGYPVPQVAMQLQKTLNQQVKLMTDMTMNAINIHVVGVLAPKSHGEPKVASENN